MHNGFGYALQVKFNPAGFVTLNVAKSHRKTKEIQFGF
jgi:hypothetical protein